MKTGCHGFLDGMKWHFREIDLTEVQSTFHELPLLETART
jgi:hypothetical protein